MSTLAVRFPDEWATLSARDSGREQVRELVQGLAEVGPEAQEAAEAFFGAVLPMLDGWGISAVASLALPDEESDGLVQALCAIAVVAAATVDEAELRALAESGPHHGLDRDTTIVELPTGPAVRSSAIRFAEELLDDDGVAPYALEVRYALALGSDRIGVLHFETMSLVYLEQLERMFDAIAGTAAVV